MVWVGVVFDIMAGEMLTGLTESLLSLLRRLSRGVRDRTEVSVVDVGSEGTGGVKVGGGWKGASMGTGGSGGFSSGGGRGGGTSSGRGGGVPGSWASESVFSSNDAGRGEAVLVPPGGGGVATQRPMS